MFATVYYELFRVGELTIGGNYHVILTRNVHIGLNKMKLPFFLRSSKMHGKGNQPETVKISAVKNAVTKVMFCQFKLLWEYLLWRPNSIGEDEPFFLFQNNTAVSGTHFREMLKKTLIKSGFNPSLYSGLSFSAGWARDLLKAGISIKTINNLGRWKSNAV